MDDSLTGTRHIFVLTICPREKKATDDHEPNESAATDKRACIPPIFVFFFRKSARVLLASNNPMKMNLEFTHQATQPLERTLMILREQRMTQHAEREGKWPLVGTKELSGAGLILHSVDYRKTTKTRV